MKRLVEKILYSRQRVSRIWRAAFLVILGLLILSLLILILVLGLAFETAYQSKRVVNLNQAFAGLGKNILPVTLPDFEKPQPEVSLLAVGDIMLSRSVEQLMVSKTPLDEKCPTVPQKTPGNREVNVEVNAPCEFLTGFTWPWRQIAPLLKQADITLGNLETAIIAGRPIVSGEFTFRTDPQAVLGLKSAGFDLVSLANNHTQNFGQKGFLSTFSELNKNQIEYVGAGANETEAQKPVIIEKQGIKFGFLAYTYPKSNAWPTATTAGANEMNVENLKDDIARLKPRVDWLIVLMHAGTEYVYQPNLEQKEFAHAAIEAGANFVIGSHPHVVQTFEKYQDGYIFYSLGNFIFDQRWSEETQQGLAAKIIFTKNEIKEIEFLPIRINQDFQPELAPVKDSQIIISRLAYPVKKEPRFIWQGSDLIESSGYFLSATSTPNRVNYQTIDLDNDNIFEEVLVQDGHGYIMKNQKVIWQSPLDWRVVYGLAGDFNHDQIPEIGFSVWKAGNFGPAMPVWKKDNDAEVKNHLFLYQLKNGYPAMVWGSSNLGQPILAMALADLNNDKKNELVILEGNYQDINKTNLAVWLFNEWNFTKEATSRPGKFFDPQIDLNYINIREINN
jgi:poly-gamma-glutamate synthesis protein (capsule biosynthesis protein)